MSRNQQLSSGAETRIGENDLIIVFYQIKNKLFIYALLYVKYQRNRAVIFEVSVNILGNSFTLAFSELSGNILTRF